MPETGGDADLALEAVGADGGGELGVQHLERHELVALEVARQHHARHPAAAEIAVERVAVGEARLELLAELGLHAASPRRQATRAYFPIGVYENFCPPTDASYMSPPFAIVTIATPFR